MWAKKTVADPSICTYSRNARRNEMGDLSLVTDGAKR